MNRGNRIRRESVVVLLLIAAIVLALALYLVLTRTDLFDRKPADTSPATESGETEPPRTKLVTDFYFDDAVAFSYRAARQSETVSYSYDGTRWHWDDDPDFPVNDAMLYAILYTLTREVPVRTFAPASVDRAAFGLEDPSAVAMVTYRSHNGREGVYTFTFGIENATLGGTYLECAQAGGSSLVCMVAQDASLLNFTFLETADPAILPAFATMNIDALSLTTAAGTRTPEDPAAAIGALRELSLLGVVAFRPDGEETVRFGLDSEHATSVTVSYSEVLQSTDEGGNPYFVTIPKTLSVTFGARLTGDAARCFFTVDGTNLVYAVSSSFLDAIGA